MKLPYHAAVSLVLSALVWLWLRSIGAAVACFVTGVFVDLDHLPDYIRRYGARIRPRHLFQVFEFEAFDNIFIFLHAWEWIAVALIILWFIDGKPVLAGALIGFAAHLIMDQLVNGHGPWSYFLTFRAAHRFSGPHFYGPREYRRRLKHMRKMTR